MASVPPPTTDVLLYWLTGFKFDWERTSRKLAEILEASELFSADISGLPEIRDTLIDIIAIFGKFEEGFTPEMEKIASEEEARLAARLEDWKASGLLSSR